MQNFNKLEFFNNFKKGYKPSPSLDQTSKLSERKELVKFRIGNHKLRIETGRYDQNSIFVNLIKLKMNLTFLCIALNTLL